MTFFLQDILRQPQELQRALDFLCGDGRAALDHAAVAVKNANHIYFTGMGSSWHAALGAGFLAHSNSLPVHTLDACDLLEFGFLPKGSVVVMISRSGRSIEVASIMEQARNAGAIVIGLTNTAESPLALQSDIPIVVPIAPDHAISVNTYSTLALAAGALAATVSAQFSPAAIAALSHAFEQTSQSLPVWQQQIADTAWLLPRVPYYFLARRSSFASAQETRLVWEEGVKTPATAMGTGSFRHGPQEVITPQIRFCQWIDATYTRESDLAVARDLTWLGSPVMLIGQNLPEDVATLTFQLPMIPREWQFLVDVIPAQLAGERLSRLSSVNCDVFRYCSFVVEHDYGLLKSGGTLQ